MQLAKIETMYKVLVYELQELLLVLTFNSLVKTIDLEQIINSMA
jgi:hypothetical protein